MPKSIMKRIDYDNAISLHNKIMELKKTLYNTFLDLGKTFLEINHNKAYLPLGFKTFDEYIKSDMVGLKRASVYGFMQVYKRIYLGLDISKERLLPIGWSKLRIIAPIIDKDNSEDLLSRAEKQGKTDLIKDVNKNYPQKRKSLPRIMGQKINFESLQHAPLNEMGVVYLFAILSKELGFNVNSISTRFPDCIAIRKKGKIGRENWEEVKIEFEFKSKDFIEHGHNENECDLIVCWEDNWEDCPLEVINLKDVLQDKKTYG